MRTIQYENIEEEKDATGKLSGDDDKEECWGAEGVMVMMMMK